MKKDVPQGLALYRTYDFPEEWKDMAGYEGLYQASSWGRVRSLDRRVPHGRLGFQNIKGQLISPTLTRDNYLRLALRVHGKRKYHYVHQCVLRAFEGIPNGLTVDHLDMDKLNNRPENLEYCTSLENTRRRLTYSNHLGLSRDKYKWISTLTKGQSTTGKKIHVGRYNTEEEAVEAQRNHPNFKKCKNCGTSKGCPQRELTGVYCA